MARRFTDAIALLGDLLDRHETGAVSPIAYPDYTGFVSVTAADGFIKALRFAEQAGAVRLTQGKGIRRDQVDRVRLESADALYRHLGRTPVAGVAREAHDRLVSGLSLHPDLVQHMVYPTPSLGNSARPIQKRLDRRVTMSGDGWPASRCSAS